MNKKNSTVKIYWQPEWATSIVYWSYTILLGCLALIIQLELIRINIYTILLGTASLISFVVGTQRYLIVTEKIIKTVPLLKKNTQIIEIYHIKSIDVLNFSVTITQHDGATMTMLMLKKQQVKLIEALSDNNNFQGIIINRKDMG